MKWTLCPDLSSDLQFRYNASDLGITYIPIESMNLPKRPWNPTIIPLLPSYEKPVTPAEPNGPYCLLFVWKHTDITTWEPSWMPIAPLIEVKYSFGYWMQICIIKKVRHAFEIPSSCIMIHIYVCMHAKMLQHVLIIYHVTILAPNLASCTDSGALSVTLECYVINNPSISNCNLFNKPVWHKNPIFHH